MSIDDDADAFKNNEIYKKNYKKLNKLSHIRYGRGINYIIDDNYSPIGGTDNGYKEKIEKSNKLREKYYELKDQIDNLKHSGDDSEDL